jgi:hypothetical protein
VQLDETDPYNAFLGTGDLTLSWSIGPTRSLEFKRTSDQRRDYRERGESRAMAQHDILVRSLKKVAGDAEGERGGWKIKLIIFVGSTSGSVHAQTLNDNLKELQVTESKRNAIRKDLVRELLNAQDTVLCSYFAQRSRERSECRQNQGGAADSKGWGSLGYGCPRTRSSRVDGKAHCDLRDWLK